MIERLQASMSVQKHIWFWGAALLIFLLFLWLFKEILLPFVLGAAIAYLLEPLTKILTREGLPRWLAGLSILLFFFAAVIALFITVIPIAYREIIELSDAVPGYIEQFWAVLQPYTSWVQGHLGNGSELEIQQTIKENLGRAVKVTGEILAGVISGGQAIANIITLCVFTPIVSFFMIKEWPVMISWIDDQLPRQNQKEIRGLIKQIDQKIAGFVRGQLAVAFSLGVIYAIALFIAKLNFGILVGLSAGLLSIIPLVGSTFGLIISVAIAWFQSGELYYVALIGSIFLVGQFIEGNFLTPKLLGKSVGMHSLWILFALMAGANLFGIVGMLIAVPIAASLGVLAGFILEKYKNSPYYKGKPKPSKKNKAKTA
jgi:predicted PurR-regulated permease PerM